MSPFGLVWLTLIHFGLCRSFISISFCIMSLRVPSTGILGTCVQWENVEKEMQKSLNTNSKFGPNKTVLNVGEGNGYLSKISLSELDWTPPDEKLPKKVVIKMTTCLGAVDMSEHLPEACKTEEFFAAMDGNIRKTHNTEVGFYKMVTDEWNITYEELCVPRLYTSVLFSEENPLGGFMCLEALENLAPLSVCDNVFVEDIVPVLRVLARLQAIGVKNNVVPDSRFSSEHLRKTYDSVMNPEILLGCLEEMKSVAPELGTVVDQVLSFGPHIFDSNLIETTAKTLGITPVLCHGDLWMNNTLWKEDGGRFKIEAVIDWQFVHVGSPGEDLVLVFTTCLSGKDRREKADYLFEKLYSFLEEELGDVPVPYTLEQLKQSYNMLFATISILFVSMFGPVFNAASQGVEPHVKEARRSILMEKTRAILEDIVDIHSPKEN